MQKPASIKFGTSGARGRVEDFTDDVCHGLVHGFLTSLGHRENVTRVAFAMDLRPSSPSIAQRCVRNLFHDHVSVENCGTIPTPALAYYALTEKIPAIMVTGSHIPFDMNGIKFYKPDGEITKSDEEAITLSSKKSLKGIASSVTFPPEIHVARSRYVSRYLDWFDGKALSGIRVGLYQHSAVGRDLSREILEQLGATVIPLAWSDQFVPIDTEAVSETDRRRAETWVHEHRLDALFTTDGDGDRPLLADETGKWWRGDILGLICAKELAIESLAIPVSCNSAIDSCGAFSRVIRTRIGSPYVIEAMASLATQSRSVAGFEANGGFLLGSSITRDGKTLSALPTRDAILPALTAMVAAAQQAKPLSHLLKGLPERYTASDRLKAFPTDRSRQLIAHWTNHPEALVQALGLDVDVSSVDMTDGLRIGLDNEDIIHLRPSGNAPELRCYAESGNPEAAEHLVSHALDSISRLS